MGAGGMPGAGMQPGTSGLKEFCKTTVSLSLSLSLSLRLSAVNTRDHPMLYHTILYYSVVYILDGTRQDYTILYDSILASSGIE